LVGKSNLDAFANAITMTIQNECILQLGPLNPQSPFVDVWRHKKASTLIPNLLERER